MHEPSHHQDTSLDFRFEAHDPEAYRRQSRRASIAMAALFLVLGLCFSQLLTWAFGSSVWLNALGVLLGLLITSGLIAVLKERPFMAQVRYGWRLKQSLSRVSAHLPALRRALADDDPAALEVLSFYYQGIAELSHLDGRSLDDDGERLAERLAIQQRRREAGLPERVPGFDERRLKQALDQG